MFINVSSLIVVSICLIVGLLRNKWYAHLKEFFSVSLKWVN